MTSQRNVKRCRIIVSVAALNMERYCRSRREGLSTLRCVFAGELWRVPAFSAAFGMLEARGPRPGPLEVVFDVNREAAEMLDFQFDLIAVHKRVKAPVVGAGGEHVAGLERMHGTDPRDTFRDVVGHVVGVEVLEQLPVVPELDLQLVRVRDLVLGDEIRPHGCEGGAGLHLIKRVAKRRQIARRAVDKVGIAEHVVHGVRFGHVFGVFTDDKRELGLAFEDFCRDVGQHHGIAVADHRVG